MNKIIWIIFALFVIGNCFFVLPFHFTSDSIISNHILNYKKDSVLLHAVFPDSAVQLNLKMPALYNTLYYNTKFVAIADRKPLLVNVSFLDNLDFFSLVFPFYKSTNIKGDISFYSAIKVDGDPERDSIALIGNVTIQVRIAVAGVCTPQYARMLMQKEFVNILHKEMDKVEMDINKPPYDDSSLLEKPDVPTHSRKRSRVKK